MRSQRPPQGAQVATTVLPVETVRSILACMGDAVVITDLESRVTFVNPTAQRLTGWSLGEADGQPLDEVVRISAADGNGGIASPMLRTLSDGAVVMLADHGMLVSRDGTRLPIQGTTAPIRDESQSIVGGVMVFRDATELRHVEIRVLDPLVYAQSIISTLHQPFLVLQQNLRVLSANQAFYKTFQTTAGETETHHLYELGDGQWNDPKLRALLQDVLNRDGSFADFEVEHEFPNIGRRMMVLNGRRIQAPDSGAELILLAMEDVTERRQAGHALQVSETRYRRLFETARDGILILDSATGHILDANPFMVELLGYSRADLCGKELWQIGLFKDIEANQLAFAQLQEQHYVRYHNLPLLTRDGQQIEVEFVSNVYRETSGTVIQCNIRDHTEHSRLERYSKEQAEALAASYRRKDEFLAMLSHELRSPLSAIANAVQMLRLEHGTDPIQRQARAIVERQSGRLASLVDDLLEVSRIATGKLQLRRVLLDMRTVMDAAVESAGPLIAARKHRLVVTAPPDPVLVRADPTRLEQVLVNLLNNAAKYTEQGGTISLTLGVEGEDMVISVRDTGVGIAPETLPVVFDLFMQAERSLDSSQGGLGVGLTLAKKLVELHGGTVQAKSAGLGHGSEFIVRLPAVTTQVIESEVAAPGVVAHPGRKRVLVVDDNADAADIIAMLLKHDGHVVRTAYTGTAALEMAGAFLPDLVLLDVGLPGMNGYEVAQELRRKPGLESTCLVAFTGYGQEGDRRRSAEAGFDHHLVKPVEYGKLQALLEQLASQGPTV